MLTRIHKPGALLIALAILIPSATFGIGMMIDTSGGSDGVHEQIREKLGTTRIGSVTIEIKVGDQGFQIDRTYKFADGSSLDTSERTKSLADIVSEKELKMLKLK